MPLELLKIVCRAVALQKDGDRIVGEIEAPPVVCYTREELAGVFDQALANVDAANEAELAAKGNRRQRRAKPKPPAP